MPEPRASLPYMPGYDEMIEASGGKLLPWSWAVARIGECRNFWLTTLYPDGRPHSMPVWGVWLEDGFGFSTGRQSRKTRNFDRDPRVTLTTESGVDGVVLEGEVAVMADGLHASFMTAYKDKYDFDVTTEIGLFYVISPRRAFGIREYGDRETGGVTRWDFE